MAEEPNPAPAPAVPPSDRERLSTVEGKLATLEREFAEFKLVAGKVKDLIEKHGPMLDKIIPTLLPPDVPAGGAPVKKGRFGW